MKIAGRDLDLQGLIERFGWLSKLWSLSGVPNIVRHLIFRVPEKDHNFDIYPFIRPEVLKRH